MKTTFLLFTFTVLVQGAFAMDLNDRKQIEKDIKREMKLRQLKKQISILEKEFKNYRPQKIAPKKDSVHEKLQKLNSELKKTEI